jgi:hypothetical protein
MSEKRDPGGEDFSFVNLVAFVEQVLLDKLMPEEEKENTCNRYILALVISRLVVLYHFQTLVGATPEAWLVYQLTKHAHTSTNAVFGILRNRSSLTLLQLQENFQLTRKTWFFAFDEAQYGYELLKEKQRFWNGKRDNTMRRGIACPFIRTLETFMMPVVIAGTALSLRSAESCKSDLGKAESSVVFTDFSSLCLAEIEQKIVKLVNLDGVDLKSTSLWKLEGRGRLFGGLILTLAGGCLSSDKIDSLNAATEKHFDSVLQGLKKCIKDAYSPPTDPLERNAFPGSLEALGIAALWGGTVALDADRFDIDLLHVGLCSIEKSSVVGDSYVLSEELGRQAILEIAQDENLVGRGFSRVVRLCTLAAGHAMEPLLVAELAAWYSRHNSPTVKQFISALFDDDDLPSNLPDWVNHASFNVKQGCSKQNRIDASCDNDIEFIALAVKEDKHRGRLLSPSTVKRPDCEVVMGPKDSKDYSWFLAASSKLYGKPFDDSNFNDLRST